MDDAVLDPSAVGGDVLAADFHRRGDDVIPVDRIGINLAQCPSVRARGRCVADGCIPQVDTGMGRVADGQSPQDGPFIRNAGHAQDGADDSGGARRIAVAVETAAHGDIHRLQEVTATIEQPQVDTGTVRPHVQSEVLAPLREDDLPCRLPVVGICIVCGDNAAHHLGIAACAWNDRQAVFDQLARLALEERFAVHGPDSHAGIDPVPVVHEVARPVAQGVAGTG